MNGHAIRELAKAWATVAHDGVSRKGAGEPYINHAERVAESVWGWRRKTIAWLHDVIEDAGNPQAMEYALRVVFPSDIIDDVMTLSRLPYRNPDMLNPKGKNFWIKQPYEEWIQEIAASGNQDVIAVKLADIEDNLHDITDIPDMQGMQVRYLKAKGILMEVTGVAS